MVPVTHSGSEAQKSFEPTSLRPTWTTRTHLKRKKVAFRDTMEEAHWLCQNLSPRPALASFWLPFTLVPRLSNSVWGVEGFKREMYFLILQNPLSV